MTTSHLPRRVAIKTFLEIPPDWMTFSQLLITEASHPRSSPGGETICELRFNGHDLKAAVRTPEAQKEIDQRPVSEPVGSVHTGELEVGRLQPS
jgi:hypothetical protein